MSKADSPTTLLDDFVRFYRNYYEEEIAELAQAYPKDRKSLFVNYNDLYRFDPQVADDFRRQPDTIRKELEEALRNYELPIDISFDDASVRVYNAPAAFTYDVGEYRSDIIDQFVEIKGQVSKKTAVKPLPVVAAFECKRCGTLTRVPQDSSDWQTPHECQGCERQGPFDLDRGQSEWTDIQLARLQLPPEKSGGDTTSSIDVHLRDDIAGGVEAGDRVRVTGVFDVEEGSDSTIGFEQRVRADTVRVEESDYQDINVDEHLDEIREFAHGERGDPYDLLVESIAPSVIGMDEIKEAIALQLFGGVRAKQPDGSTKRGDSHILLLGDPGTAKSTILEDVHNIAPCSTMASGKGASAAGMTAAATKDDFGPNEFALEAGAMVLADGGVACIDEIDKVNEETVSSLHEALSRQIVNINKAGINAHLPTRTALLAAGNPQHGRFVDTKPIGDQIDLGPTILSRFDLMFMIDDAPDRETDERIIEGIIENRQRATRYTDPDRPDVDGDHLERPVSTEIIRPWIAHAKQHVYPTIEDPDLAEELKQSFTDLRMANGEGSDAPVPVTHRKLEGIQRLAQASARVRLSNTVEMQDIDRARRLVGRSMADVGMDPQSGQLDADVIETGTPKSQKQRIEWVHQFIDSHEGKEPVPHSLVIDESPFTENLAEHAIGKLKEQGEIYEPESDHYRTT